MRNPWLLPSLWVGMLLLAGTAPARELTVATDFEGGSGHVESIDPQRRIIRLQPTLHAQRGWRCWWYVRVEGLQAGQTLTLDVGRGIWATPDRAMVSGDNRTWTHSELGQRFGDRIVYTIKAPAATSWFAWGPPYVPADARRQIERAAAACPAAEPFELCKSRGGRSVPAIRVAEAGTLPLASPDRLAIWVQARQHAWESGSSWVCQGFLDWLVSDAAEARRLRQRAHVTVVPVVDIDNVALGAGGKEQAPHDHNRDWSDEPYFPAVKSAMAAIKRASRGGGFDLYVDLHNPGPNTAEPYFYTAPRGLLGTTQARNLDRFLSAARLEMRGPLEYRGHIVESGPNYDHQWQRISKNWVSVNSTPHVVAVTLETPWNTPRSTTDGYLQIGRELGRAIERYARLENRAADHGTGIAE